MRMEARLNAIEKRRQDRADREMAKLSEQLKHWTDAELNEALMQLYKTLPEYKDNPAEVDRLFLPENETELAAHLRASLGEEAA